PNNCDMPEFEGHEFLKREDTNRTKMAMLAAHGANACYAKPFAGKPLQLTSVSHSKLPRRRTLNITRAQTTPINPSIRKEEPKVVDNVPLADLSKPVTAYC
ncbi:hypothetical protein KI387_029438, partial [Taxus chinensis]